MPLRGRTSALGEGQDISAHSDGVAVGEEARAWRGPEVRLQRSAEAECAPKNRQNTSAAVGGVRSRALIGYRKGGGKSLADGL